MFPLEHVEVFRSCLLIGHSFLGIDAYGLPRITSTEFRRCESTTDYACGR
jgi:hypothetical protein